MAEHNKVVAMARFGAGDGQEMIDSTRRQAPAPPFLYGTAWKEDDTARLTELAIRQRFRGIDTANQRKHYHEAAVGEGIAACIREGLVARDDLFLQTKFTFLAGQDDRLPYDPKAPIAQQVVQSFDSSLAHLKTDWIDSYVLHGPTRRSGLGPGDWEAWSAMESLFDSRRVRALGVSNVALDQLQLLCDKARVPPRFVQNRCYAATAWDREVRTFCRANEIIYQGFSLLTANRGYLFRPEMAHIAARYGKTVSQIVFRFALDVGMLPLTGTTSSQHMREDLSIFDFRLTPEEVRWIEDTGAAAV
jgi:diketogulonate reductase-like aldo/keto reductase